MRWSLWLLVAGLVSGCAGRLPIDHRYQAKSQDSRVQFIVLHFTAENFTDALRTLTQDEVSSHYLVRDEPAKIYQLVDESRRAWHAGPSYWQGVTALNAASVGIEIVNPGDLDPAHSFPPYPEAQIQKTLALVRDIATRHHVKPHRIVGHGEIQPQTKNDPGPRFPWKRLADEGLIPWPDEGLVHAAMPKFQAALPSMSWFQEKLSLVGFQVPRDGRASEETRRVLAAFQMRYRPERYDGVADAETAAWLSVASDPAGLRLRSADGVWRPYVP
jgi:N-acetylmuramoyl-L-alanine amidase